MISRIVNGNTGFTANPLMGLTAYIDERIMLNKAILDASVDVPMVLMANNPVERRERFNRAGIAWVIAFASPYLTLPLTNRLAMKHIAKITKSYSSDPLNKLIKISNKYLHKGADVENAAKKVMQDANISTNISEVIQKSGGAEKFRQKIVNAKNSVLAFDLAFTTGTVGSIGFYNNWRTKKRTGRDGFSAEFSMADKGIIDKRAEKYKKAEGLRKAAFYSFVGLLALMPLAIKRGLASGNFIKKHAHLFDYDDGILLKRFPLFLACCGFYLGMSMASRNRTELKDNLLRATLGMAIFFGGDRVVGTALGKFSDKVFKTDLIDKNCDKNFINKILPPIKNIKDMDARSKKFGAGAFWLNLALLSAAIGFGAPYVLNRFIKRDVSGDISKQENQNYLKQTLQNSPLRNLVYN
ncbi:MAG: hypothetical protein LBK53_02790 [Heliobacteriaceae bacterium]|jgi:hypothetical protein|nr:hypothetical protein [Heliobacteriaceae bacterium]